ncbi:MAG: pentapeptide repeat-containing protein [Proteobacteria bacterium]|nr:pentapeptide repeat-containing protein [Pseudomonadota bacterium]
MSDDPKEPDDRAADSTQPDEAESPKLREVSEEELKEIFAAHRKWVESEGKEGEQADLQEVNLYRAKLKGALLREADLRGCYLVMAELQEAILIGANLQGAKLREANLQNAHLQGAFLQEAELLRADLRHARMAGVTGLETAVLTDINLEGATGLLGTEFAGTDITGAKLPTDIAKFEGLDHVTEISKHARNIFLAVIGGCAFSWLTIATTTDVALLINTASTPLPIIQTKVPIAGFYLAAPAILLGLYFYLHMYLQRLWSGLASLPAIFPDGRTLDERAYPWLLTSLVRAHVPRLRANRPPFSQLQVSLSIVSAWVLVPFTICLFWLRYLVLHDWWIGTILHIALVTVAVTLGASFYWHLWVTLRGDEPLDFRWRTPWKALKESKVARTHVALILCVAAAAIVVSGGVIERKPGDLKLDPRTWNVPVFRLNLQGINLQDVDLAGRNLKGANFRFAGLQRADLRTANLQDADLGWVNLQNANLRGAQLNMAFFDGARLQGTDLREAKGLTQEQLDKACGDEKTKLPEYLKDYKLKPCPKEPK